MLVDHGPGSLLLGHRGHVLAFCSDGCRSRFARAPERFSGPRSHPHADVDHTIAGSRLRRFERQCPECAERVQVPFALTTMLGSRTIDEVVTVARHRWRRRASASSPHLDQPASLVRSLIVLGLEPASPVRDIVARIELDRHIGCLADARLTRKEIRNEMRYLFSALDATLADSGVSRTARSMMMNPIDALVKDRARHYSPSPAKTR